MNESDRLIDAARSLVKGTADPRDQALVEQKRAGEGLSELEQAIEHVRKSASEERASDMRRPAECSGYSRISWVSSDFSSCMRSRTFSARSLSKHLGFDPALTGGPFEPAFQDVLGITIFLSLATALLHWLT
jgi:hypothetical protein